MVSQQMLNTYQVMLKNSLKYQIAEKILIKLA